MMRHLLRLLCVSALFIFGSSQAQVLPTTPSAGGNAVFGQGGAVKDPRARAKIHTELGALYYQEAQIPVAMEELTIAIAIDPTYAPAWTMRALVHNYLKEPQYAEDNFREAFRLTPDDPELFNNYGWFLCQNGKEKDGIGFLLKAVRNPLYQTPDRAYLNAGQCAMKARDYKAAEEYLERASRLSGGSLIATIRLAELNFRTQHYELARQQISDAMRQVEPNAEMLWLAARIERKLGERQGEINYSNQLRRKFPKSKEYEELLKGNYE